MEKYQYSKTFDKIPTPDIAISMGCDVGCSFIGILRLSSKKSNKEVSVMKKSKISCVAVILITCIFMSGCVSESSKKESVEPTTKSYEKEFGIETKSLCEDLPYYAMYENFKWYSDFEAKVSKEQKNKNKYYESMYVSKDAPDFMVTDYKDGICINRYIGRSQHIEIPDYINNKPVIKIGMNLVWDPIDKNDGVFQRLSWTDNDLSSVYYDDDEGYNAERVAYSVTFPKYLKEISAASAEYPFSEIYVSKENPYYSSEKGILYNKDKTILIAVPLFYDKKEIKVADETERCLDNYGSFINLGPMATEEHLQEWGPYTVYLPDSFTGKVVKEKAIEKYIKSGVVIEPTKR